MCNTDNCRYIQDVVAEKVQNEEMFTAFDISLEVQKLAKQHGTPVERHRHMKNEIHNVISGYTHAYDKKMHPVGNGDQAFLYFPPHKDPNNYVPVNRPQNNPAITTQSVASTDTDDVDDDVDGRSPDARGSISVPACLIRAIQLNPGDQAYVAVDNNDLVISKDNANCVSKYTVDHHCNVRLTKHTLAQVGLNDKTCAFVGLSDKVVVKAA